MSLFLTRRSLLAASVLLSGAAAFRPAFAQEGATGGDAPAEEQRPAEEGGAQNDAAIMDDASKQLAQLEKKIGGRLGVSILDTETNISLGYKDTEHFPLCSTWKALAAGFVLSRVDQGAEKLDRRVTYTKDVLVTYSPVTEKHVADGMTIAELCEAAVTLSDNTAGNLLLDSFGGPAALTAWLRTTGDSESRLDRREPDLNEAKKDDPRDTTDPASVLDTLGLLTLGNTLGDKSRDQLTNWLVGNKTGDARLRAGMPKDWRIGDKTGTGNNGSAADIAIVFPPDRGPLLVAAYMTETTASMDVLNGVFAEIGKMVADLAGK